FSRMQCNYDEILATAGTCTDDAASQKTMEAMRNTIAANNKAVSQKEAELNSLLKSCAKELTKLAGEFKVSHQRLNGEVVTKLASLKARGIATDIPGLELLLRQKTSIAKDIAATEQRSDERKQCRDQRERLRGK